MQGAIQRGQGPQREHVTQDMRSSFAGTNRIKFTGSVV